MKSLLNAMLNVFLLWTLFLGWMKPSAAIDSASFEFGTGNESRLARVAAQWDWGARWWQSNGTHLGGHWDLSLAQVFERKYRDIPGNHSSLTDVGLTPVFRFQADDQKGAYAEAGVGIHLMSHLYDNNGRRLSTAFQFGDHVGLGYRFQNGLDLGVRFQHFSNGSIKQPNNGVNFAILRLAYPLH